MDTVLGCTLTLTIICGLIGFGILCSVFSFLRAHHIVASYFFGFLSALFFFIGFVLLPNNQNAFKQINSYELQSSNGDIIAIDLPQEQIKVIYAKGDPKNSSYVFRWWKWNKIIYNADGKPPQ